MTTRSDTEPPLDLLVHVFPVRLGELVMEPPLEVLLIQHFPNPFAVKRFPTATTTTTPP